MNKIEKLFKNVLIFFKSIANKKFTDFLCGSLKKSIIYIFILLFVFMSLSISFYISPKTIQAEPITLTSGIVIALSSLLVVAGFLWTEKDDLINGSKSLWYSLTHMEQEEVADAVADAEVDANHSMSVSGGLWDLTRSWAGENLTGENPQTVNLYTSYDSPWTYFYNVYDLDGDFTVAQTITEEQYEGMYKTDLLSWNNKLLYFQCYNITTCLYYKLYVDGTAVGVAPYNSYSGSPGYYTNIYFTSQYNSTDYYLKYKYAGEPTYILTSVNYEPYFAFIRDITTGYIVPVVVYYNQVGQYKTYPLVYNYSGEIWDAFGNETTSVDVYPDMDIVNDEDFDFVIDGQRDLVLPDSIDELIGISSAEILSQEWADSVETGIGSVATELELIDLRLAGWDTLVHELSHINSLNFSETGALEVEVVNAGSSTSFPELDIPESDFDLPTLELLSDKFPFSIPFDFYNAIANLEAEPVAPDFEVVLPDEIFGADVTLDLDFSIFENIAKVVRWIILLGFVISLILITRKLIRG